MAELVVDGQVVAGFAAEATPHFDDDGVKVLVEWRPVLPVQGVGENGTRMGLRCQHVAALRTRLTSLLISATKPSRTAGDLFHGNMVK